MVTCVVIAILVVLAVWFGVEFQGKRRVIDFCNSKYARSVVAIIAAIVMYYTPDEIDRIILAVLALFEITPLTIDTIKKDRM